MAKRSKADPGSKPVVRSPWTPEQQAYLADPRPPQECIHLPLGDWYGMLDAKYPNFLFMQCRQTGRKLVARFVVEGGTAQILSITGVSQ